jgi:hypothetical protein
MKILPVSNTHRIWRFVLIALLVWGFGMRLYAILVLKEGLSHDESVTYLCASATEGVYQEHITGLVDRQVLAGEVGSLYDRPASLKLGTVANDLAIWDIHPPMYFWTLHAVHVLFGAGIIGGALLNLFAGLCLLLLTFVMARRALGSTTAAWAAVALWYLSPAVVPIDLEARHYQFMALFAMASFLLAERLSDGRSSVRDLVLFTVVNALGLLTHYYYVFLLVPGAAIMLWRTGLRLPFFRYLGSLLLSLGLFLLAFPQIMDFIRAYLSTEKDPSIVFDLGDRVKTILYASLAFFSQAHYGRYLYLLLLCAGCLIAIAIVVRKGMLKTPDPASPIVQYMLTMLWAGFFTVALYLLGISPSHAAGEQYLAYFWPLLAIGIVHAARAFVPPPLQGILFTIHMVQLCFAFDSATRGSGYLRNALPTAWYSEIADADLLIIDDRKRSGLPRIMRHIPTDHAVVVLEKDLPDLGGAVHVVLLHLALDEAPIPAPVMARITAQGYRHAPDVERHEYYELHHFRR